MPICGPRDSRIDCTRSVVFIAPSALFEPPYIIQELKVREWSKGSGFKTRRSMTSKEYDMKHASVVDRQVSILTRPDPDIASCSL